MLPISPIRTFVPSPKAWLDSRLPEEEKKKRDDGFWKNIGDEIREALLNIDEEGFNDAGHLVKDIGDAFKDGWKHLRKTPVKVLSSDPVRDKIGDSEADWWIDLTNDVARGLGFAAAGGSAVAGTLKFLSGKRQGNTSRKLEGLVNIASGVALAVTVAGLSAARLVTAPLASGLNVIRGGYNAVEGFRQRDKRKQLQGVLDATRSAGSIGRVFKKYSPLMKGVGIALAPVAGGIQVGRGLHDVGIGLKNQDNGKELKGLADIATAVGTSLAFASGAAVIPGVALAVAANVVKIAYRYSPKFRKYLNPKIDKIEPKLEKLVEKGEKITRPAERLWEKVMGKLIKRIDADPPASFSKAEITEIARLVHCDGKYSKEENRRLRAVFETVGQKKQVPSLKAPDPESARPQLVSELDSEEKKLDFLRFALIVSEYDFTSGEAELSFLREMASDLGIDEARFESLRAERRSGKDHIDASPLAELGLVGLR